MWILLSNACLLWYSRSSIPYCSGFERQFPTKQISIGVFGIPGVYVTWVISICLMENNDVWNVPYLTQTTGGNCYKSLRRRSYFIMFRVEMDICDERHFLYKYSLSLENHYRRNGAPNLSISLGEQWRFLALPKSTETLLAAITSFRISPFYEKKNSLHTDKDWISHL